MSPQLASLITRPGKPHAVNHIIHPALQEDQKILTGNALHSLGHEEVLTKLSLQDTVGQLGTLFLPQLHAVLGGLATALAVLARRIGSTLDGTLIRVTAIAFQKQLHIFPATLATT
jgi:hypothetical protein